MDTKLTTKNCKVCGEVFTLSPGLGGNNQVTCSDNYRVFYVNRWGRWINFKVTNTEGRLQFRGYRIITDDVLNKESA